MKKKPTKCGESTTFGTLCFPAGRKIEVVSPHMEWTAWAVDHLESLKVPEARASVHSNLAAVLQTLGQLEHEVLVLRADRDVLKRIEVTQELRRGEVVDDAIRNEVRLDGDVHRAYVRGFELFDQDDSVAGFAEG